MSETLSEEQSAELTGADFTYLPKRRSGHPMLTPPFIDLSYPEAWPEPVDGAQLIARLAAALRAHVAMSEPAATTIALWLLHAHALDAFTVSPRLLVTSPARRSGKSTLLELLSHLLPRAIFCANAAPQAILKALPLEPSLVIDDAGLPLLRSADMRGVLIDGRRRASANLLRLNGSIPSQISAFRPVAIALLGDVPEPLRECGIEIRLERKRDHESVGPFRPERAEHLPELNRMCARWADDNIDELRDSPGAAPQNWLPLLAIADTVGGDLPSRTRAALAAGSTSMPPPSSLCEQALADIAAIFQDLKTNGAKFSTANGRWIIDRDRIRSSDLANRLAALEGQPWAEWGRKREPLTGHALAHLLKPFGITPAVLGLTEWDQDGRTQAIRDRGYHSAQFTDAFDRYVRASAEHANA